MKTKLFFSLIIGFIITSVTAQKSFFETLDAHGVDAKYQGHGGVYTNSDGEQVLRTQNLDYHMFIERHKLDEKSSGVTVKRVNEKNVDTLLINNYNAVQLKAIKYEGFPNTSILYHSGYNQGYVAIDNAVYFVSGFSKDKTDFREIDAVLLLDGSATEKDDSKKKKKGKLWKKLKDAALSATALTDPAITAEYKELMKNDPEQIVRDYLKAMKAKQNAYTMTAKDKNDLEMLYKAASDQAAYVKKYNKAYWASPEGQAILRNGRNVEAVHAEHLRKCRTSGCDNNAHN